MTSHSSILIKVANSVKLLKKLPDNEYETENSLEYFKRIDNSFNDEKSLRTDIAKVLVENGYPEISLKYLKHYMKNFFENEQAWPCAFYLLRSIWNFSDVCAALALECSNYVPILLDILSNDGLLSSEEEDEKLFKLTLNIMNNIAHQPESKIIFQQHQASKILKNLSNIQNEHLKVLIYLILAQIVNENEFDKLNDPSNEVVECLCTFVKESLKKDHRYKGISTSEYMDCIAKLAVTKENKSKIIENGMLSVFKQILTNSNIAEEQNNTLTCIWNLCFDDKICEQLKKEKELVSFLTNLKNSSMSSEDILKKAAGILFTLNDLQKKSSIKSNNNASSEAIDSSNNHIMISYNYGSRDLCLKIKEELKAKGYQVWIDVEQIYGSTLASMAEAVENASVFLMCVSEKYYLSPNCRLEAEYAVKLQKPIIPLIMQSDYNPLGWLGIIIGGKIYYKFAGSKQSFDQTFNQMLKEVSRYDSSNKINNKSKQMLSSSFVGNYNNNFNANSSSNYDSAKSNKTVNGSKLINDWSTREVKQWVTSINLMNETDMFDNLNGEMLKELHEMKKNAPEIFYGIIKSKLSSNEAGNFSLHDMLKISTEINELFKNQQK